METSMMDVSTSKIMSTPYTPSADTKQLYGAATPSQNVDNNMLKLHPALAEIVAMSSSQLTALSKVMKQYATMHPYDDLTGDTVNKRLMIPHDLCISFDETEVIEYTGSAANTSSGSSRGESSTPLDTAAAANLQSASSPAMNKAVKLLAHWSMFHKNHLR